MLLLSVWMLWERLPAAAIRQHRATNGECRAGLATDRVTPASSRENIEHAAKIATWRAQALLDDAAVLTCMSYVDLNPLRAGMAATLESSDFTSIQQRLRELTAEVTPGKTDTIPAPNILLMPLTPQSEDPHPNAIGFSLQDYLELVDWAGRAVREGKRRAIDGNAPPILERLNLDLYRLIGHVQGKASTESFTMLGKAEKLKQAARDLGRRFIKGISEAQRLYRSPLPT